MPVVIYEYQVPDLRKPLPAESPWGPSGELIPFVPEPVDPSELSGKRIDDYHLDVGTYGMGGPAFFGLRFGEQ